jgi:hypothetical protein
VELGVLLESDEEVRIDRCSLRVDGWETCGDARFRQSIFTPLVAELSGDRVLAAGTTPLPCTVAIPEDAPSTLSVGAYAVSYEVAVHASVPWWPDAHASFALNVVRDEPAPIPSARVVASRVEGPADGSPYAELSLAADVAEPGGVIDGAFSARNVSGARYATVSLVAYAASETRVRAGAWSIRVALPAVEGEMVPFAIRLADDVPPSTHARRFHLEHRIELDVRGTIRSLLQVSAPIRIVHTGKAPAGPRLLAPRVGDARLEQLYREAAAAIGAEVEPGPELVLSRGEAEARMTRTPDGERMQVSVRFPPLGIDLHVHEASLLALAPRLLAPSSRMGVIPERFAVHARDLAQAEAWLGGVADLLEPAERVELHDDAARLEVAVATQNSSELRVLSERTARLCEALSRRPPLPPQLAASAEDWRQLARELGGTLAPGCARVQGELGGARVEVVTLFDAATGRPSGTDVSFTPADPIEVDASLYAPDDPKQTSGREARAALAALERLGRVRVDRSGVRVRLDAPIGPVIPVSRALEIAQAALRLVRALRPSQGPFR